ncbi:amino acid/polyamine transporter I [Hysterangium stoloniferum]|nr:amino acid/polyamine transporter I [Hysterangium stoloniferum]
MSQTNPASSLEYKRSDTIQQQDDDSAILRQLGLKHELRREFTRFSTISLSMAIMGCAQSIAPTANTPLLLGGPATLVWSWAVGSVGSMAIATSVAGIFPSLISELVSAYPTAGGVYTSTAFVYPSRYRTSVTFINGWFFRVNLVGQLAAPASGAFAVTQMIYATVTLGTNGSFVPSKGQTVGLFVGLNILLGIMSSFPTVFQNRIASTYLFATLIGAFAVIIGVPVGGRGHLASSEFVWTRIIDNSGWNNRGFAFFLGLFSVQWVMVPKTGYDACAHMSEEVKRPAFVTPIAITLSVTITAVVGFFVNVSLCYGVRDLNSLPGPTGLVFSQILWDNLGRAGAVFVMICIIIPGLLGTGASQLVTNGLPDRKLLSKVWGVTQTPTIALVFLVTISILFGLLLLASSVAIPILGKLLIHYQSNPDTEFKPGPFYLGKWGYYVNMYAIAWTIFETGILIMPQVSPVTTNNMNYTGPIVGGVNKYYVGPRTLGKNTQEIKKHHSVSIVEVKSG